MSNDLAVKEKEGGEKAIKPTPWTPTETQVKLAKLAQNNAYKMPIAELCTEAGIGRQTYYDWQMKDEFREWWIATARKWASLQLPNVYHAGLKSAKGAVVAGAADRKLMLELLDKEYAPKHRTDGTVHHKITWGKEVNSAEPIDVEFIDVPALPTDSVLD